jgi:nickel/cobalt transporter (NiCoT) family protein
VLTGFLTVFVLGLRHGADPDHLAIIDNLTRNAYERHPHWSRYVGTLFAGGHSVMVLAIAALAGLLGEHLSTQARLIETAGTWVSLTILLLVAVLNIVQLRANGDITGSYRTRMLPAALRSHTHVLVALPVGVLFGLGFETSSQLATYAVAFTSGAGLFGAITIGFAFCAGIMCTDTLDSILVHRFLARSPASMLRAKRLWLSAVTIFALVVAAYQGAQLFGWIPPLNELTLSALLMFALVSVYVCIMAQPEANLTKTRR